MTGQAMMWAGVGASAAVTVVAVVAEHRRNRRRDLDAPGWMPWTFVQVVGFLGTLACAALAVRLE